MNFKVLIQYKDDLMYMTLLHIKFHYLLHSTIKPNTDWQTDGQTDRHFPEIINFIRFLFIIFCSSTKQKVNFYFNFNFLLIFLQGFTYLKNNNKKK